MQLKYEDCKFCISQQLDSLYSIKNYVPETQKIVRCITKNNKNKIVDVSIQLNHTLFHKYSSSQNYYYTKELNEIFGGIRTRANIDFNDFVCLDEDEEYLKRFYMQEEYAGKISLLSEFYKFHKDLPRWSIQKKILRILNYYYDKKRKLEYYKIQKMIQQENEKNPDQPPKGIVGDQPLESDTTPMSSESSETVNVNLNVDNILNDINFNKQQYQSARHGSFIQFDTEEKSVIHNICDGMYIPSLLIQKQQNIQQSSSVSQIVDFTVHNTLQTQMSEHQNTKLKLLQQPVQFIINEQKYFKKPPSLIPTKQTSPVKISDHTPLTTKGTTRYQTQAKTGAVYQQQKKNEDDQKSKKKFMQKKQLELDEAAFSISKQIFEPKMPMSARTQPISIKLIDQLTHRLQLNQKQNHSAFRDKITLKDTNKELLQCLKGIDFENSLKFTPNLFSRSSARQKVTKNNGALSGQSSVYGSIIGNSQNNVQESARAIPQQQTSYLNLQEKIPNYTQKKIYQVFPLSARNGRANHIIVPNEIKKLEMKVLRGLQDLQRTNSYKQNKMFSFDQKSLTQLLKTFSKKKNNQNNQNFKARLCESYSQIDSQILSRQPKAQTPRSGVPEQAKKVNIHNGFQMNKTTNRSPAHTQHLINENKIQEIIEKLDLRKLNLFEKQPQIQSARIGSENKQASLKQLKTDRQFEFRPVITPSNSYLSSRNSQHIGTPKQIDFQKNHNGFLDLQKKAIQAASKEYNINISAKK